MIAYFKNEFKSSFKNLIIWSLAVGGMGLFCILLYKSMEGSMGDIAGSMASMGAFSEAFGMSTLSIATLKGYFSTEVGTIHSLGGAMFAASVATIALSREEDAHTAEYTFTLPLTRGKIITAKLVNVLINLVIFTLICAAFYIAGFYALGENIFISETSKEAGWFMEFLVFMLFQLMMSVEIAALCILISAYSQKNKLGVGISVAMLLYAYDLIARVVPKLKDYIFVSPFSYCNATGILSGADTEIKAVVLAALCIVGFITAGVLHYSSKDLAA